MLSVQPHCFAATIPANIAVMRIERDDTEDFEDCRAGSRGTVWPNAIVDAGAINWNVRDLIRSNTW